MTLPGHKGFRGDGEQVGSAPEVGTEQKRGVRACGGWVRIERLRGPASEATIGLVGSSLPVSNHPKTHQIFFFRGLGGGGERDVCQKELV